MAPPHRGFCLSAQILHSGLQAPTPSTEADITAPRYAWFGCAASHIHAAAPHVRLNARWSASRHRTQLSAVRQAVQQELRQELRAVKHESSAGAQSAAQVRRPATVLLEKLVVTVSKGPSAAAPGQAHATASTPPSWNLGRRPCLVSQHRAPPIPCGTL